MRITKQLQYYIPIGFLTVFLDYILYTFLKKIMLNISEAKAVSFIAGTFFSFLANRMYTFKSLSNIWVNLYKYIILYATTLYINVTINKFLLNYFIYTNLKVQIAFVVATTISAIMNFLGMKYFVFINNQKKEVIEKN